MHRTMRAISWRATRLLMALSVLMILPACAATAQAPPAPSTSGGGAVHRNEAARGATASAPEPMALPSSARAVTVERRLEMRSTAYCLRGTMRTGVRTRDGMMAADPAVLPLGSVVRVSHPDGRLIGIFVVMDTGGSVRGNKIDLWFPDCGEAEDWGTRSVVAEVIDIGRES